VKRVLRVVSTAVSRAMILLIKAYRIVVSPMLPPRCRHLPTCSEYFIEAVERHGPLGGGYYGLKRVLRCHPWGTSGIDPVPPTADVSNITR